MSQAIAPHSISGLTTSEVIQLRQAHGFNEIPEKKTSLALKLLSYFWGPIPGMIEVAALLSAAVRHWADCAIISALLVVNAIVGFWEEYQAGNIVASLKAKLALQARVLRDGSWSALPARELLPQDVIRVRIGDIVPADAQILSDDTLLVDQSALTGESLPVTRQKGAALYSGAIIKKGEANAVVTDIGIHTYFGRTAQLTEEAKRVSHFQKAVLKIGDFLILFAVVLVALILAVALVRHEPLATTLEFCLVLTVAAIPVALPTILSVTLAIGARKLGKQNAVVTRLASIEEMAGVEILCCDKTGTLTENRLSLGDPYPLPGQTREDVVMCAALSSREEDRDPIDLAILEGAPKGLSREFQILSFQPFDPTSKRTEATVQGMSPGAGSKAFQTTKGAVQVVLALCPDALGIRSVIDQKVAEFARRGYRALAVARKYEGEQWRFLGVLPLYDPPREDSKQTIEATQQMGVQVKMLTGDQAPIASEIARQLGLGTNILNSDVLPDGHAPGPGWREKIEQADGFAQVFPEHKFHIVEALQSQGHITGMTGDGVNDAPALKKADVGVAVFGATDAARDAADIVLLVPGLATIVAAIRESRRIFNRMLSYATYRITETLRVLLFMTASILVFNFYPVTAVMIVLLALLNDGAILAIAYDHAKVSERPERWNMKEVLGISTVLGVMGVISSFGMFFLADRYFKLPRPTLQTLMYLKLSVAGHLTIFLTRVKGPFWSFKPSRWLVSAVFGTQAIATLIALSGFLMPALSWHWVVFVWAYALIWFFINDRVKLLAFRYAGRFWTRLPVKLRTSR